MADRETSPAIAWLSSAGAASICTSLLGCVGILGAAWMQYSGLQILPFVLLLLVAPLFALAELVSRKFILGLWALTAAYPMAALLLDREMYSSQTSLILFGLLGTLGPFLTATFSHLDNRYNEKCLS